jgi:hypothetical protein
MRTKTLLLTAALAAAGIASSMAQAVYSVNAVGYVNTTLKPGYNLVSNPLNASVNNITTVFAGVPGNTRVFTYSGTSFTTYTYVAAPLNRWTPDGNAIVGPGDGVFVFNPGTTDLTITFVGEVPQGTLDTALPTGLSIKSSKVPQAGLVSTDLKFPGAAGDKIFRYTPGTGYSTFQYVGAPLNRWTPSEPSVNVGEAFFVSVPAAKTWSRVFSVNS